MTCFSVICISLWRVSQVVVFSHVLGGGHLTVEHSGSNTTLIACRPPGAHRWNCLWFPGVGWVIASVLNLGCKWTAIGNSKYPRWHFGSAHKWAAAHALQFYPTWEYSSSGQESGRPSCLRWCNPKAMELVFFA